MKGNTITCINCNHTGQYVGDYIRCHNCKESLYVVMEAKKPKVVDIPDMMYLCYECDQHIEEDTLVVEERYVKRHDERRLGYRFYHERCKNVPAS